MENKDFVKKHQNIYDGDDDEEKQEWESKERINRLCGPNSSIGIISKRKEKNLSMISSFDLQES